MGRPPYTTEHLFLAARCAGERMFGGSRSGLVFPTRVAEVSVERVTLLEIEAQAEEDMGIGAYVDEYEFIFFPSCLGKGLDVSNENWADARPEWRDVDGLVYTAWSEGVIRIVDLDR